MSEELAAQAPAAAAAPVAQQPVAAPTETQAAPIIKKEISDALNAMAGFKGNALNELKKEAAKGVQPPATAPKPEIIPGGKTQAQILAEQANKAATTPPAPEPASGIPSTPVDPLSAPAAPAEAPASKGVEIDNPLLGGKKNFGPVSVSPDQPKFESIEAINSYIESNHEGVKDIHGFVDSYVNQTTKLQDLSKDSEQLGQINDLLSKLPTDLHNALGQFERGEEWRDSLLNAARIDYNKESKDIPMKDMVNNYFPGEIPESDWEEYNSDDASPYLKRFIEDKHNSSVNMFDSGKEQRNGLAQKSFDDQAAKNKAYKTSVSKSLDSLRETHPDIHENTIKAIEQDLSNNSIFDKFYDKTGNLLPEAASRLALLEHGPALIDQLTISLTEKAETSANLDTLTRGNQVPGKVGSDPTPQKTDVRPGFKERLEELTSGLNGRK